MSERGPARALRTAYIVASLAGVAFFALSVGLLGVWPARLLDEQTRAMAPEHPLALTASEQRGRQIYGREGCAYCHTQQIRYLHADMERFGAPTLAWEGRGDTPHLWGTRRIGPDVSRTSGTRSLDWHFAHLYAPRTVVPASVMPAYPWLFDGDPARPRQDARDLVAYLESLGRAREIAGPEGEARAREGCQCEDDEMAQMAFQGPLNAHRARARRGGGVPPIPRVGDLDMGRSLYAAHCATCHGTDGKGDGPAASALTPAPARLAEHDYSHARLTDALWNGVAGSAMPAWRDRAPDELAALARAVQALATSRPEPEPPAYLVPIGARVYAENCAQCHGVKGDGRGSAAASLAMAPTNFVAQRPSLDAALRAIRGGIPGTPMAPWTPRLSQADIVAVAHHVRAFYAGPAGAARP